MLRLLGRFPPGNRGFKYAKLREDMEKLGRIHREDSNGGLVFTSSHAINMQKLLLWNIMVKKMAVG